MNNYYYQVMVNTGIVVERCAEENENLLIFVSLTNTLPDFYDRTTFVVLHGMHANNSQSMSYDWASGSVACRHCGRRFNLSKEVKDDILHLLSAGEFEKASSDNSDVVVYIAHLVAEFPKDRPFKTGYYVKEVSS